MIARYENLGAENVRYVIPTHVHLDRGVGAEKCTRRTR